MYYNQNNFNGGEVTPWMDYRNDFKKYRSSLRRLENFICTPYGPLRRRVGTQLLALSPGKSRLLPFQRTSEEGYILEVSDGSLRVFNQGVLEDTFAAPWLEAEMPEIHFVKLNDIIIMVHGNHPPQELRYLSPGNWSFTEVDFDHPAFLDPFFDGTFMTVVADAAGGSTTTINYNVLDTGVQQESASVPVNGNWEVDVTTYTPKGGGPPTYLKLQRSSDGGVSWTDVTTIVGVGTVSGVEPAGLLRLVSIDLDIDATLECSNDVPALSVGDTVVVTHSGPGSGSYFTNDMVGSELKINHAPDETEVKLPLSASSVSDWIALQGDYTLTTTGNWGGTVYLEKSDDNGATVEQVIDRYGEADRNITYQGTADSRALYRIRFERGVGTTANSPHAYLESNGDIVSGRVLITAVNSPTEVEGTVTESIYSEDATDDWQEAAWSDYNGWPRSVTWHEGRIIYAGTLNNPDRIWFSGSDDYYNFRAGTNDDQPFSRTIASDLNSEIVFLASQDGLVVGTGGDAWMGKSYSDSGTITPSSIVFRRVSDMGGERIQPVFTSGGILHVQRNKRALVQLGYSPSSSSESGFYPTDMNLLNRTITGNGISNMSKQPTKDNIVWAVNEDGLLIALSHDSSQDLFAWHRHITYGEFTSVCSIYEDGGEDALYITVNRAGKHTIERFHVEQYDLLENGAKDPTKFLDCSISYSGASTLTPSGFDDLDDITVQVVADGVYVGDHLVTAGQITLDEAASEVTVGFNYTSLLETLPVAVDLSDGSLAGRMKKVEHVLISVYRSQTAQIAASRDGAYAWQELKQIWRKANDLGTEEEADSLGGFESWKIPVISGHDRDARIAVKCDVPAPLNILSINQKVKLTTE